MKLADSRTNNNCHGTEPTRVRICSVNTAVLVVSMVATDSGMTNATTTNPDYEAVTMFPLTRCSRHLFTTEKIRRPEDSTA